MRFADKLYMKTCEYTKESYRDPNQAELSLLQKKYWPYNNDEYNEILLNSPNSTINKIQSKQYIPDTDKLKFKGNLYVLTHGLVFSSALPFAYSIQRL